MLYTEAAKGANAVYGYSTGDARAARRPRGRRARLSLWNKLVLAVGYLTLLYGAARGVMQLLVLLK